MYILSPPLQIFSYRHSWLPLLLNKTQIPRCQKTACSGIWHAYTGHQNEVRMILAEPRHQRVHVFARRWLRTWLVETKECGGCIMCCCWIKDWRLLLYECDSWWTCYLLAPVFKRSSRTNAHGTANQKLPYKSARYGFAARCVLRHNMAVKCTSTYS